MLRIAIAALALAACSAPAPDVPPASNMDPNAEGIGGGKEDSPGDGWAGVGFGVEYQEVNTGTAIVIAYGGYSAHLAYSAAWASELVDAKLGGEGVGRIYAVQGPRDPGYDAKEIGNSKLRAHLETIDDGTSPIYIVAHSSGTYVAHELLDQLYAAGQTSVLARISYWNLDGGGAVSPTTSSRAYMASRSRTRTTRRSPRATPRTTRPRARWPRSTARPRSRSRSLIRAARAAPAGASTTC